jgi:NAD(P)-dependent dehydrogenase (short-subunit alcohol dehydrogenase family)
MKNFNSNHWALILGGSSGFGLAAAKKLSQHGMNIMIVHRDRRGSMAHIEKEFDKIKSNNTKLVTINTNALTTEGRSEIIARLKSEMTNPENEKNNNTHEDQPNGPHKVRLLLHSIALGNLKPIAPQIKESAADVAVTKLAERLGLEKSNLQTAITELLDEGFAPLHSLETPVFSEALIGEEDMQQTIYNMGTSFLSWVQDIHKQELFASDARVIGLTSEGNEIAWKGYAAVAAAKVALESVSRSIAVEFAPFGIRSNILQPGVTPTPALKLIPGSRQMKSIAQLKNPYGRTTTPEDVADFIALMCTDEAAWINGNVIRVDGGEKISSL